MSCSFLITFAFYGLARAICQNSTECHDKDLAMSLVIITPKFPAVYCTGTLLNSDYVLTAAHCLSKTTLYVYAGLGGGTTEEKNLVKSEVADYHIHSKYERRTMINDVAIVRLKTSIEESDVIKFVHFRVSSKHAYEWDACKDEAFVMGLIQVNATSTSGTIYCSAATVYPGEECESIFKKANFEKDMCVTLNNKDLACVGDSGGPVFCGDAQVGVISWGGCASAMLCKVWGMPKRNSQFVGLGVGKRALRGNDDRLCVGTGCAKADPSKPFSGFPFVVVNVDKKITFMRHYAGNIRADAGAISLHSKFSWTAITRNLLFLTFMMFTSFTTS